MRAHILVAGLAGILSAGPANAELDPRAGGTPPGAETFEAKRFIGRSTPGILRASDFVGREVYGLNDQVLGEVADVLFGPDGRMSGLIVEIDSTFGIGERRIRVPMGTVRIDPAATATTGTAGGIPPSTETGLDTRQSNRISIVVHLERITLTIPPEAIQAVPPFQN